MRPQSGCHLTCSCSSVTFAIYEHLLVSLQVAEAPRTAKPSLDAERHGHRGSGRAEGRHHRDQANGRSPVVEYPGQQEQRRPKVKSRVVAAE